MAKQKEVKQPTKAETLATIQRVGYIPGDDYELLRDMAKRARLHIVETKMGEVIRITCEGRKFYTDAK